MGIKTAIELEIKFNNWPYISHTYSFPFIAFDSFAVVLTTFCSLCPSSEVLLKFHGKNSSMAERDRGREHERETDKQIILFE